MIEVLLATYNGEPFLAEQLESLLGQEGVELSILVRDDGSSDNTTSILESYAQRYPGRLTMLGHPGRLGGKGSFGWLLDRSQAPYVACCDQDDVWRSHKLVTLLRRMQTLETTLGKDTPLLVHSDLTVVDEKLNEIDPSFWSYGGIDPARLSLGEVLIKNPVTGCALLANRALLEKACPIPEGAAMHDHWLALVATLFGRIDGVKQPLVLYRQHGRNAVGAQAYGWRHILDRLSSGCGRIGVTIARLRTQADVLNVRFAGQLKPEEHALLDGFARLSERSVGGRLKFLIDHGILMQGLFRNLALALCVSLEEQRRTP